MPKPPKKKPIPPKKRSRGNPRGRAPDAREAAKMDADGYVTVAAAARAVNRAPSSIYDRVHRYDAGELAALPAAFPEHPPVKKGPSGNVWLHLKSIKRAFGIDDAEAAS